MRAPQSGGHQHLSTLSAAASGKDDQPARIPVCFRRRRDQPVLPSATTKMNRPTVEVADILREHGNRFLDRYEKGFDFQQFKAFRKIEFWQRTQESIGLDRVDGM